MSGNIIIVEDDRDLGEIIFHRLRRAGHHCVLIPNSKKAFPLIKDKKPDLAIIDVMMPKVSGYELCRQIRRDPLIFNTPILMMSALGSEPEIRHALEQGADEYIVKPFDSAVLFSKVKTLLEKQARITKTNSLTGFHGVDYMKRLISNKLFRNELVATCYIDLMHFAPYVKVYGEGKRDEAVKMLADILKRVMQDSGVYECATAHLGGADFMVLLAVNDCERYCTEVISRFQQQRGSLYNGVDLDRGAIQVRADLGGMTDHPLMSVAVGVVTSEKIKFRDSTQMVKVAGEINKRAQQQQHNGHIEILREGLVL